LFVDQLIEWPKKFMRFLLANCDIFPSLEVAMLTFPITRMREPRIHRI